MSSPIGFPYGKHPQELPQGAGGVRNIVANDLDPNAVVPWLPWSGSGKGWKRVLTLL